MPLRIYDVSKKLGIENKEVLAKAKALGIAAARVPSSSLDRMTAEYLEEHLLADHPEIALRLAPPVIKASSSHHVVPETAKEKPQSISSFTPNDDQSLAILLKKDASIDIYSFSGAGFQHQGSFAFHIDLQTKPETNQGGIDPEEIILLTNNESATLEFKLSARWDLYQNRLNPDLQKSVCKTVAAFLNTEGGTLLIGVADNARVVGLKQDMASLQKPKNDDYILYLHNILFDVLGNDLGSCIDIAIVRLRDKDICRVAIRKSPRPVYVKEGQNELFFVRVGNSSKSLPLKAAIEYCKARWTGNSPVWL